ncbi:hypothetical protein [Helicobacter sp. T3_23-1059]
MEGFLFPPPLQMILPLISPSRAEGVRGWVSCHTKQTEASQNLTNICHTEVSQETEVSHHCKPCLHGVAIHNVKQKS